jgi:hypothetical protein
MNLVTKSGWYILVSNNQEILELEESFSNLRISTWVHVGESKIIAKMQWML